jgi:hypothetical protein
MKAVIEGIRIKEMDSCKASKLFNVPQKHYSVMLNTGRKAQAKH